MITREALSDSDLAAYAEMHLQYELDMLVWSAGILGRLAPYKTQGYLAWAVNNGMLNTFAMHARNLIGFLYPSAVGKQHRSDVTLAYYLDDEAMNSKLAPISPILKEAITKANKQVAHLTLERVGYEQSGKAWNFIEVARGIKEAFAGIAPYIPSSKMSEKLRAKLSEDFLAIPLVNVSVLPSPEGQPAGVVFALPSQTGRPGSA